MAGYDFQELAVAEKELNKINREYVRTHKCKYKRNNEGFLDRSRVLPNGLTTAHYVRQMYADNYSTPDIARSLYDIRKQMWDDTGKGKKPVFHSIHTIVCRFTNILREDEYRKVIINDLTASEYIKRMYLDGHTVKSIVDRLYCRYLEIWDEIDEEPVYTYGTVRARVTDTILLYCKGGDNE